MSERRLLFLCHQLKPLMGALRKVWAIRSQIVSGSPEGSPKIGVSICAKKLIGGELVLPAARLQVLTKVVLGWSSQERSEPCRRKREKGHLLEDGLFAN